MKKKLIWVIVITLILSVLLTNIFSGQETSTANSTVPKITQNELESFDFFAMEYLGIWMATAYTDAPEENGGYVDKNGNSITATGNLVVSGHTVAVQSGGVLPYGSIIYIEGIGIRMVDDCGVGAEHVDIAVETKEEADEFGVQYLNVWVIRWGYAKERLGVLK